MKSGWAVSTPERAMGASGRPAVPEAGRIAVDLIDPSCFSPGHDDALVRALARAGCDARLLTSEFLYDASALADNPHVRHEFFRLCSAPLLRQACLRFPRLRQLLKAAEYPVDWLRVASGGRHRPSPPILHFQWVVLPALDRWIVRWLRSRGFPVVYTVHNVVPHGAAGPPALALQSIYRAADALVVHTMSTAEELLAWLPDLSGRIWVLPPGLHHERTPEVPRAAARERLGLGEGDAVVLFLGAIMPYKGLATLLDAFATVASEVPAARLVIVGKAEEDVSPYLARVRDAGLSDRVQTHFEYVPTDFLAACYAAADVVALPYRKIYHSGALLTAFRYGVPVVATDVGGFRDAFGHGLHGYRVPPDDPPAMAQALRSLLCDPAGRARMREHIRLLREDTYSWDSIARRTLGAYEAILAGKAPR